jgi:predicted transcriptional regulator
MDQRLPRPLRFRLALAVAVLATAGAVLPAGPVTAAPLHPLDLTFSLPGRADGALAPAGLEEVLLWADPGHPLDAVVDVTGATLTNTTAATLHLHGEGPGDQDADVPVPPSSRDAGSGRLHLRLGASGLASLRVEAHGWSGTATAVADLVVAPAGSDLAALAPDETKSGRREQDRAVPSAFAVVLDRAASRVDLAADALASLEWTNAEAACEGLSACPTGARDATTALGPGPADTSAALAQHSFERLAGRGRLVALAGTPALLVAGGAELRLGLTGTVRLPVSDPGDLARCDACLLPDGQTLRASGDLVLADLRPSGDGRLEAVLGGDATAARLDELSVDPAALGSPLLAAGVAVAAVGVAALVAKLLGSALLTRMRGDPLEHPRRARLLAYIKDHPGATFREVARSTGTATGTARHHLSMMKRHSLVVERPHGGTTRFFENHGKYDATWSRVVLLREEPLARLHGWLAGRPEASQKEILVAMEREAGWSRSTTQHRIARLQQGGLVAVRLQGRLKFYSVRSAVGPGPPITANPLVRPVQEGLSRASLQPFHQTP